MMQERGVVNIHALSASRRPRVGEAGALVPRLSCKFWRVDETYGEVGAAESIYWRR